MEGSGQVGEVYWAAARRITLRATKAMLASRIPKITMIRRVEAHPGR